MPIYTIDSIADGIAKLLLQDNEETIIYVPLTQLPEEIKEGDLAEAVLHGENITYFMVKTKETKERADIIKNKLNRLLGRSK